MKDKITFNVPDGHIMKEEKTENGLIITFVKKEDFEQEKVDFFRSCINGCTIRLSNDKFKLISYEKSGITLFQLREEGKNHFLFLTNFYYIWEIYQNRFSMQYDDIKLFLSEQVESVLKIKKTVPQARFL